MTNKFLMMAMVAGSAIVAGMGAADAAQSPRTSAQAGETTNYCPAVYLPVFAISRDGLCVRFTNACHANAAGAKIVPDGTCGFHSSGFDNGNAAPAASGGQPPWPFPWKR